MPGARGVPDVRFQCFTPMSAEARNDDGQGVELWVYIRQSCVDSCDAQLETPEDSSVKRPSNDLDFGAPDAILVLSRVVVEVCTLLGCHVAVGDTIKLGAYKVCCYDLCSEKEL